MFDVKLGTKFLELGIIKLLVIISDYSSRYVKPTYNIGPNEDGNLSFNYSKPEALPQPI